MAPNKRSRVEDEFDEAESVTVESVSSELRNSQPQKRARLSLARDYSESPFTARDELYEDATPEPDGWRESAYGHGRNEVEEQEYDDFQATQIIANSNRNVVRNNIASEHGVIEEVFCRNFMCHAKLRVKLGPNINFIIGHNGSGKSAVLTALQMCLGGKAQATNRATNLRSMIKEGEENAMIAVRIKNQGDDAFQPELYGPSIIVERHFSRAGTSMFKIKSAQDKIISTKKAVLDDILDYFAFQLDNPINVLSQDNARQFLSNSSAADKYKFFIRGTQLEALDADYKLLEEHLDNMEDKLHSRKSDIDMLRRTADEAEKRKKASDMIATIEDKITRLQWMHAWAQVVEVEKQVEASEQKVRDALQHVEEKKDQAQDTEGILEGHNQTLETAKGTLTDLEAQYEPIHAKFSIEKEVSEGVQVELSNCVGQQRQIKENLKSVSKRVKEREKAIKEEQSRLAGAEGPEHAERLEQLAELKTETIAAKTAQEDHLKQKRELEQKMREASQEVDSDQAVVEQAREKVQSAEGVCRNIEKQRPDALAGYRPRMADLIRAVHNETRWRKRPIGPVGTHVKLLDDRWMSPVERTFGGALDSFVVFGIEDSKLMNQIMRRVNCIAPVVIGNDTPLDTNGKEPDGDIKTILRVLDIDNDAVRNQLIINHAIDQTVLIHDRREAYAYMYASGRPRNVKATICFLNQRNSCLRFEFSRNGGEKSGPVGAWTGATRMKSDHENQIRIQRNNVANAKRELDAAEIQLRQRHSAKTTASQELVRFGRRQRDLVLAVQAAEDAVDSFQAEIESHQPQDGKLQELERQQIEDTHELETLESSYQDSVIEKDALIAKQRGLKEQLREIEHELDQMSKRLNETRDRVSELTIVRRNALYEHNAADGLIKEAEQKVKIAEETLERDRGDLAYMEGKAMEVTPQGRVPVEAGMTADKIDQRLEKLIENARAQERRVGGTREQLMQEWHSAVLKYQEADGQMKSMAAVASELKKTLSNRQYRWTMFRRFISARARMQFAYLLSERQFRGRLLMDHQAKELYIKVEPDLTKQSDAGREAKTLSGGEKSFSTICLLLSIWEAMGSPIRCLDEFDVFMDSVNRSTSMAMMIQAARRSAGRQFILITPQAMNDVEMGPDVRIHRMMDPERGQQTLPFV